jgi:hypothetical protein
MKQTIRTIQDTRVENLKKRIGDERLSEDTISELKMLDDPVPLEAYLDDVENDFRRDMTKRIAELKAEEDRIRMKLGLVTAVSSTYCSCN